MLESRELALRGSHGDTCLGLLSTSARAAQLWEPMASGSSAANCS